jgi:hypothetical protein
MAGAFKLAEKMEGAGEASKLAALSVLATPIQE